jgi:ATP-dependent protease HslVU (ClpYQ) peptidase subunit
VFAGKTEELEKLLEEFADKVQEHQESLQQV